MEKIKMAVLKYQEFWLLIIFILMEGVYSNIEHLELTMPKYAPKGGEISLRCEHSVNLEDLHKVEWRKGGKRFFRYIKGRTPPFQLEMNPGGHIDIVKSSYKEVHLTNLTFEADGNYHCVVSMEKPSIYTKDSDTKTLLIYEPQIKDPEISFSKEIYYIGENLQANCTTSVAYPKPHVTWFINDEKVLDPPTRQFTRILKNQKKFLVVSLLNVEVSSLHAGNDGKLKLTCWSTIPGYVNDGGYADFRNTTVEVDIQKETPQAEIPSVEASSSSADGIIKVFLSLILFFLLMLKKLN